MNPAAPGNVQLIAPNPDLINASYEAIIGSTPMIWFGKSEISGGPPVSVNPVRVNQFPFFTTSTGYNFSYKDWGPMLSMGLFVNGGVGNTFNVSWMTGRNHDALGNTLNSVYTSYAFNCYHFNYSAQPRNPHLLLPYNKDRLILSYPPIGGVNDKYYIAPSKANKDILFAFSSFRQNHMRYCDYGDVISNEIWAYSGTADDPVGWICEVVGVR